MCYAGPEGIFKHSCQQYIDCTHICRRSNSLLTSVPLKASRWSSIQIRSGIWGISGCSSSSIRGEVWQQSLEIVLAGGDVLYISDMVKFTVLLSQQISKAGACSSIKAESMISPFPSTSLCSRANFLLLLLLCMWMHVCLWDTISEICYSRHASSFSHRGPWKPSFFSKLYSSTVTAKHQELFT